MEEKDDVGTILSLSWVSCMCKYAHISDTRVNTKGWILTITEITVH
jgi:hypothetical protein